MKSVAVSHETLFIYEVKSVVRDVVCVAILAVGVYHVKKTKVRETDAIVSRASCQCHRMRLRNETKTTSIDTRIY
eukprot:1128262-Prymnesium_polylepis.1